MAGDAQEIVSPAETSWEPICRQLLDAGYCLSMTIGSTAISITRSEHR
jgi:hypothetical protein